MKSPFNNLHLNYNISSKLNNFDDNLIIRLSACSCCALLLLLLLMLAVGYVRNRSMFAMSEKHKVSKQYDEIRTCLSVNRSWCIFVRCRPYFQETSDHGIT